MGIAYNRRLPNFIAVGPQRTGTTWLYEALREHVGLSTIKETDFFLKNYGLGLDWYLKSFPAYPPEIPIGEIDPNYFGSDLARERIARHIPDCKIICTFRDPVDRAWSCYRVLRRDAWTRVGFEQTLASNALVREGSRYAHYLARWRATFGKEHLLVCLYDDLVASPQKFLDPICDFIGIPRIAAESTRLWSERVNAVTEGPRSRRLAQNARNARDWLALHRCDRTIRFLERAGVWRFCFGGGEVFAELDPEVGAKLREQLRPEIVALEEMIGRDLSAWRGRPSGGTAEASLSRSQG